MSDAPETPAAPPPKRGWSTWSASAKVLMVVVIGFGVLFVGSLITSAIGLYWLYSPGSQVASVAAVSANSIGLILTVISLGFGLIIAFPIWLVTLLMLVGSLGPDTERVNEALREGRPIREP